MAVIARMYDLEVGGFHQSYKTKGRFRKKDISYIDFHDHDLRAPLVGDVEIGRAANPEEDALCGGESLGEYDIEAVVEPVMDLGFVGRASYNGKKVIIPSEDYGLRVSRNHGMLAFNTANPNDPGVFYLNKTQGFTYLWVPVEGIVGSANGNEVLDLRFAEGMVKADPGSRQQEERCLLLVDKETSDPESIGTSYYVRIIKTR